MIEMAFKMVRDGGGAVVVGIAPAGVSASVDVIRLIGSY